MKLSRILVGIGVLALLVAALPAAAHSPGGAIFTTVVDGSEVNFNIYALKSDVYLDGGPGPGAPQGAAALDDGTYVFQITDPSGKTLLSEDAAKCRQFTVTAGVITAVVVTGCQHATGDDVDHAAKTVQMIPYKDTPNNGNEYKAWVVTKDDFLAGCSALGVANGLDVIDCGFSAPNKHGFICSHSKTDNFKVGRETNLEIDTTFLDAATGQKLTGLRVKWTDTLGGSNTKYAYSNPQIGLVKKAHVEAVERGVHTITVENQPGCRVTNVNCYTGGCNYNSTGPGIVPVTIKNNDPYWTKDITVTCDTTP